MPKPLPRRECFCVEKSHGKLLPHLEQREHGLARGSKGRSFRRRRRARPNGEGEAAHRKRTWFQDKRQKEWYLQVREPDESLYLRNLPTRLTRRPKSKERLAKDCEKCCATSSGIRRDRERQRLRR